MPRPRRYRLVGLEPNTRYFKPRGIPMANLEDVILTVDEIEAIRLADLEGLYQEVAAQHMNISRQTFGRILSSARKKIAEAIIHAKALRIDGGDYIMADKAFQCVNCNYTWQVPQDFERPRSCPACLGSDIHRALRKGSFRRRGRDQGGMSR